MIVDFTVADTRDKAVHARFNQILRVREVEDFCDGFQIMFVSFVNGSGIGVGFQLRALSFAVVHPKFYYIDFLVCLIGYSLAGV